MRCCKGFTLIELLITLAIMAVLATLVVPMVQIVEQRQKEQQLRIALKEMRQAIDAYKKASDAGRIRKPMGATGYPPTLQILVDGVEDQGDPKKNKIFFLRRLPRDPMADDPNLSDEQTWMLRSYASEATDVQAGADVYDVLSSSRQLGLNGVAYNKW